MNKKIKILKLDEFIGKTLEDVRNYLFKEYPKDGWELAGEEYRDWLYNNPDKTPEELKDDVRFHFMKDVNDAGGNWDVPYSHWHRGKWFWSVWWLGDAWGSSDRVLLLEASDESFETLKLDPLKLEFSYQGKKYKIVEN